MVLNYLTKANRLTSGIKSKAVKHIESGYQRELTYRREDGSFSAFGKSDKAGSTWLTAYVMKSFIQARPYIDVEQTVISKGIEYMFAQQAKDGSFVEHGKLHDKRMQGGSAQKLSGSGSGSGDGSPPDTSSTSSSGALTAYVLIAILHENKSDPIIKENEMAIQRAVDYVYK